MLVSVLLIDDEVLVRGGFRHALEDAADVVVVGDTARAADGLLLAQRHRPHVVLTADVTEIARLRTCAAGGVIALAVEGTDEQLHRALTDGARGFLHKRASHEELLAAVRAVARAKILATTCWSLPNHNPSSWDKASTVQSVSALYF